MQLSFLTPLASAIGLTVLPAPARTLVTIALVLSSTTAMVALLQRTPLSKVLPGTHL